MNLSGYRQFKNMNTNEKGIIAESMAIFSFFQENIQVFKPIHDYSAIDLLITRDLEKILKVQVKYISIRNGKMEIPKDSVVNGKRIPIKLDLIDAWACYISDYNKMIFLHKDTVMKNNFRFRFEKPKRNHSQSLAISNIDDYNINNFLNKLNK